MAGCCGRTAGSGVGPGADEALGFWKLPGGLLAGPPVTEDDARGRSPISQVLGRLGVVPDGAADEFDSAGLGRHRHTGDWLA